jgi:hypothetical protein
MVPRFDGDRLRVTEQPPEQTVQAIGSSGTLVARTTDDARALEWTVIRGGRAAPVTTMEVSGVDVTYRQPSAIALPDGRFALAFLHACPAEHTPMLLTLDESGQPIGEPIAVALDEEAFRPRLAAAADGRALLAYSDSDDRLRAVPISCGIDFAAATLARQPN